MELEHICHCCSSCSSVPSSELSEFRRRPNSSLFSCLPQLVMCSFDVLKFHYVCYKSVICICTTGNVWPHYSEKGMRIGSREVGDRDRGDIIADITTSFFVLMGIFFPSVTGTSVNQSFGVLHSHTPVLYLPLFRHRRV